MTADAEQHGNVMGTVAPGFESVKQLYQHKMNSLAEKNTQLCIYHDGKLVVDLWASQVPDPDFSADSLINVFSSSKSLAAIAMASLVSKGLLDYDKEIAHYWPEFAANGKQDLRVCDLLRHEAGLAAFDSSIPPEDLLTDNIKQNRIGALIEAHKQTYRENGSRREYHAITRGWILNEIFRRVDPNGRTIGEFLDQDVSTPLGTDVYLGLKQDKLKRVSNVFPLSIKFQFFDSLRPKFLGRRMELNIFQLIMKILRIMPAVRNGTTKDAPPPYVGMKRIAFFNEPDVAMGETPSANANCSARGLAKVAAMMAGGGAWDGKEYLSSAAWQALHDKPIEADMGFTTTAFTQGGIAFHQESASRSNKGDLVLSAGRDGFYGWMGLGGSIFQWHPEHKIGFAYAPTSLNVLDLVNERGSAYQAEVVRCISKLESTAGA